MKLPIYMDNHATTPVNPAVFEAMRPYFMEKFGNASSAQHSFGWTAKTAIEKARQQISELIQCKSDEIIFTSGATESNNMVILGTQILHQEKHENCHIVTSNVEHSSVLAAAREAERRGASVTFVKADKNGQVSLEKVQRAVRPDTRLISIIFANNEIGTINPISQIGQFARSKDISFHTDAVQAVGKVPVDVNEMNVDFLSLSAHKIYGPKGVGALYRRTGMACAPLFFGGSQESGLRSGTMNVPGAVGLGEACEIALQNMPTDTPRITKMRDQMVNEITEALEGVFVNGHPTQRLPNNVSLSFENVAPDHLLLGLKDVACSSGSACSGTSGHSHVLQAIGRDPNVARSTLRLGLCHFTTQEEVDYVIQKIIEVVNKSRSISAS